MKTSSSRERPVSGLTIPVSFLALTITSTPFSTNPSATRSRLLGGRLTGKRDLTASSRRRCCPNRPCMENILSHLRWGYLPFNNSTSCALCLTNTLGRPISCASVKVTENQSSGWERETFLIISQQQFWSQKEIMVSLEFVEKQTCWIPSFCSIWFNEISSSLSFSAFSAERIRRGIWTGWLSEDEKLWGSQNIEELTKNFHRLIKLIKSLTHTLQLLWNSNKLHTIIEVGEAPFCLQ